MMFVAVRTGNVASLFMIAAMTQTAQLDLYVKQRIEEFDKISAKRREQLGELAAFVRAQHDDGRLVRLIFICTHNSRRSQMAQVWSAIAAEHYGVVGVEVYSGGTEATAFNHRAVAALRRAGVEVVRQSAAAAHDNPTYAVRVGKQTLKCFSKLYNQEPNPADGSAAVMTCSEADENCPSIVGARARIALAYQDPKFADGTDGEASAYDDRCAQIAREMLYVFSQL